MAAKRAAAAAKMSVAIIIGALGATIGMAMSGRTPAEAQAPGLIGLLRGTTRVSGPVQLHDGELIRFGYALPAVQRVRMPYRFQLVAGDGSVRLTASIAPPAGGGPAAPVFLDARAITVVPDTGGEALPFIELRNATTGEVYGRTPMARRARRRFPV